MIKPEQNGMLQKAILEIMDERPEEIKITEANKKNRPGISAGNLNNKTANVLKNGSSVSVNRSSEEAIRFVVQFNPTELHISAEGEEECSNFISDVSGSSRSIAERPLSPRARVNFKLIFDDTDNEDAFLYEKSVLDPKSVKNRAGNYYQSPDHLINVQRQKGRKEHTVRHQVEGFMAALRHENTRRIRFIWGNLSYSGFLNTVSANYTMFNPDGNPIRAEVQIGILCMDEKLEKGNMGQWQRHYEDFVKGLS